MEWEKLPRASIFKSWSSVDTLLNSFDTDKKQKASVFGSDGIQQLIERPENSTYWQVRKVLNK